VFGYFSYYWLVHPELVWKLLCLDEELWTYGLLGFDVEVYAAAAVCVVVRNVNFMSLVNVVVVHVIKYRIF
jgi:hypothetical protein